MQSEGKLSVVQHLIAVSSELVKLMFPALALHQSKLGSMLMLKMSAQSESSQGRKYSKS